MIPLTLHNPCVIRREPNPALRNLNVDLARKVDAPQEHVKRPGRTGHGPEYRLLRCRRRHLAGGVRTETDAKSRKKELLVQCEENQVIKRPLLSKAV